MIFKPFRLLFFCSVLLAQFGYAEVREWSDKSGKFKVEAEFVAVVGDAVRLKKANGKTISVPFERLSENDREYLRGRTASNEPSNVDLANASILRLEIPSLARGRVQQRMAFVLSGPESSPVVVSSHGTLGPDTDAIKNAFTKAAVMELFTSKNLSPNNKVTFFGPSHGEGPGIGMIVLAPNEAVRVSSLRLANERPKANDTVLCPRISDSPTRRPGDAQDKAIKWLPLTIERLRYAGSFMKLISRNGEYPSFDSSGLPILNERYEVVGVCYVPVGPNARVSPEFVLANSWDDIQATLKAIPSESQK